jgi:hypothetical protein
MKLQHALVVLTATNVALLLILLGRSAAPVVAQAGPLPVLRGSALEIVDAQGVVRASITINPPEVVDGKSYPESVLLRLRGDGQGGGGVKLDVSSEKAGLRLVGGSEGGAVDLRASRDGQLVRVTDAQGREHLLGQ